MRKKATGYQQRPMANVIAHEVQQTKGKPSANAVTQEEQQVINQPRGNTMQGQGIVFTQEKYDQILKLINKDNFGNQMKEYTGTINTFDVSDTVENTNWIVNSSAPNHMVHNEKLLNKIDNNSINKGIKVYLPDGKSLDIAYTRECRIGEDETIRNALYVPDFKYNLLPVSKLTKDLRCFVSFYPDF